MSTTPALLLRSAILLCAFSGCATTPGVVSLRPDGSPGPEECSEEARKAMKYMRIHVGDSAWIELDMNQLQSRRITLYDGPLESMLKEELGTLERTTRLYGRVWTSGPQVVIRYYEAHPPNSEKVPICAVARLSQDQFRKRPESLPGTAIFDFSLASADVVDAFR